VLAEARVVALGPKQSAYSFTTFKAPGMPDELFESQHRSRQREFENIRARFAPSRAFGCRVPPLHGGAPGSQKRLFKPR
jgi:hypothetical protein